MVRDDQNEEYQLSKGQILTFKYAEPFAHHYLYRGAVDNHNYMCHGDEKNSRSDWIMHGSPTCGQSDSLPFL